MHDHKDDSRPASNYECLVCGEIVSSDTRPGECPNCDSTGSFRDRAMAPE